MKVRAAFGFVAAALLAPGIGSAEFVYTGIDVGYVDVEFNTGVGNLDGDGYRFAGSWELNERFFLQGEIQDQSYDSFLGASVDGTAYELGLGYHHSFSTTLDFVGTLSFVEEEVSVSVPGFGVGVDQDGFALGGETAELLVAAAVHGLPRVDRDAEASRGRRRRSELAGRRGHRRFLFDRPKNAGPERCWPVTAFATAVRLPYISPSCSKPSASSSAGSSRA